MRKRIVGLTLAAAVLAITLFGLPLAVGVAKYYLDDERSELERTADSTALSVADSLAEGQPMPALESGVAVYGVDGRLVAGDGPSSADDVVAHAWEGTDGHADPGSDLVFAVPVTDGGQLVGAVRARTPLTDLYVRTGLTWLAMLGLAVGALALTWLVAKRMAARLARPLEELSLTAHRLGEGDFTARTRVSGVPEIDSVGSALDTTGARIGDMLDRERAFSANASHQLRTPLTGLRLQLEAALEAPDADVRDAVRGGIATADRLERTIHELLALARGTRAAVGPLDLRALLTEAEHEWAPLLRARGRNLTIVSQGAPAPHASAAAVRQILGVLLDNAVTHGAGTVTLTARDAVGALAIDVADEGEGIEEVELFPRRDDQTGEDAGRLPGSRDTGAGRAGHGHGIGLPLARNLAEAEGGRLWLSSPAPPVFTLLLPVG